MARACDETPNLKPFFVAICTTLIVGILISSLYIFSAVYSPDAVVSLTSSTLPKAILNSQNHQVKPIWEAPSPGSKIPPLKDFRLTKELVGQRAKDNVIILTFGNFSFRDFILNWVKHLTDLGLSNLIVGAMDTKLLEELYWKGVPVFDMGSKTSTEDLEWGSTVFHKLGRDKIMLLESFLTFGYEVLMCDTDVVWLRDPLPYLARYPEADVLTSTDEVVPSSVDERLDDWEQAMGAYNIGIFHWRPTESAKKFVGEWKQVLLADDKVWDQNVFNDLLRKRKLGPPVDEESGLVHAYDRNLKLGLLPASIFCNGHTYFVQAMYQQLRLKPYAVHTTFQFSRAEGKRHRMRERMLYYDHPDYYDTPGGFLSFDPLIPRSLLFDGNHTIKSHFELINYQLKQIRTALAIASVLNRTLVMPPMWCRLDRLWFSHPGKLKGSMTQQPFLCPLDHVFEIDVMLWELHEKEFGPQIDFREYSFLDNPSFSKEVRESRLEVQLCRKGSKGCEASDSSGTPKLLRLPMHSNEETLQAIHSRFKDVKVLIFSSMHGAFSGFSDPVREQRFRNRVKQYTSKWCCMMNHDPGEIYYDMYWDEKSELPLRKEDDHPPS